MQRVARLFTERKISLSKWPTPVSSLKNPRISTTPLLVVGESLTWPSTIPDLFGKISYSLIDFIYNLPPLSHFLSLSLNRHHHLYKSGYIYRFTYCRIINAKKKRKTNFVIYKHFSVLFNARMSIPHLSRQASSTSQTETFCSRLLMWGIWIPGWHTLLWHFAVFYYYDTWRVYIACAPRYSSASSLL